MKINDILEVEIIDNDLNANGIARINNFVLFIPFCLKGEIVSAKIIKLKKNYAFCKLIDIKKKSVDRCESICPYYNKCGGCNFLHINFNKENDIKKSILSKMFNTNIDYYYGKNDINYRNKATFHVKNGKMCYFNNESHKACFVGECKIVNNKINDVVKYLSNYDLTDIYEIMIRVINDKTMIHFLCNESYNIKEIINDKFNCVYVNNKYFYGEKYLVDIVDNFKFSIYPNSFYQVNTEGMIKIYDIAKKYAEKGEKLLDLYCGTGTIGIWLSKNFNKVVGYEINETSISNAKLNTKLNNINNIDFILENASFVNGEYDVIIVDPPRSGLSHEVILYLNKSNAERIIYISCNPFTLKRDLKHLSNYNIKDFSAFNMFVRCGHVECVVLFNRKK